MHEPIEPVNLPDARYTDAEAVLRRALEAQDAEESWTGEERRALSAHIEEGYLQAERGELIDGAQARLEIQAIVPRAPSLARRAGCQPALH
jgi:hypothetical protein